MEVKLARRMRTDGRTRETWILEGDPASPKYVQGESEFAAGTGLPVAEVAAALREFLTTARRPECVTWVPERQGHTIDGRADPVWGASARPDVRTEWYRRVQRVRGAPSLDRRESGGLPTRSLVSARRLTAPRRRGLAGMGGADWSPAGDHAVVAGSGDQRDVAVVVDPHGEAVGELLAVPGLGVIPAVGFGDAYFVAFERRERAYQDAGVEVVGAHRGCAPDAHGNRRCGLLSHHEDPGRRRVVGQAVISTAGERTSSGVWSPGGCSCGRVGVACPTAAALDPFNMM